LARPMKTMMRTSTMKRQIRAIRQVIKLKFHVWWCRVE
jgi:hypothetical protein